MRGEGEAGGDIMDAAAREAEVGDEAEDVVLVTVVYVERLLVVGAPWGEGESDGESEGEGES